MLSKLEERKAARFKFLETLYEMVDGSEANSVYFREVGKKAGLDLRNTNDVYDYLVSEGLVKGYALGGAIVITHRGIKEYEAALSDPVNLLHTFPQ